MGCERFEVGVCLHGATKADDKFQNIGNLTAEQVMKRLDSFAKRQVLKGESIYVRPMADDGLILLDDLSRQTAQRVLREHKAGTLIETSPGNFQVLLRVAEGPLPQGVQGEIARDLCARYGADPGAATERRYARLAGFTNRKPNRVENGRGPLVRLDWQSARYAVSSQSADLISEAQERIQTRIDQREKDRRLALMRGTRIRNLDILDLPSPTDRFRNGWAQVLNSGKVHGQVDASRIDHGVALAMLAEGYSRSDVKHAILDASPEISDRKGKGADRYAERTVEAAASHANLPAMKANIDAFRERVIEQRALERSRTGPTI